MSDLTKSSIGRIGEEAAAIHLSRIGYTILERNFRSGHSEIDIICENDTYTVFVEVKTRRQIPDAASPFGSPASAVDSKKQSAILRGADAYIKANPTEKIPRIDVIEVYISKDDAPSILDLRHFENAVCKTGKFSKKSPSRRFQHEAD